jgi:hypothetical protein
MSTFNLQYPQTNMRYINEDGNTRFVTDFKGFTMLRAVSMYSTNDMCKGRAMVYLDEAIDVDVKASMKRGEGSFMSAVLSGDLLDAMRKADECNYQALVQGLIKKEIEL